MAGGDVQITFAHGGFIHSNGTGSMPSVTLTAGSVVLSPVEMRKRLGLKPLPANTFNFVLGGYAPPKCCRARRGGPRSKIFCEQYAVGEHTQHVGRSPSGRWYSWDLKTE